MTMIKKILEFTSITSFFLFYLSHVSCTTPQIGMILADQVDVGMAAFYATAERGEVIDLSSVIDMAP